MKYLKFTALMLLVISSNTLSNPNSKRIAIVGSPGSGKSTIALKLHAILNIPIHHLDKLYWKPNWTHPDLPEFKKFFNNLCNEPEWIIEGMYPDLLSILLEKADIIIFLDISRYTCLLRVIKRALLYYNKLTFSSAQGCPERLNFNFFKWTWNFPNLVKPEIIKLIKDIKEKEIYMVTDNQSVDHVIQKLKMKFE